MIPLPTYPLPPPPPPPASASSGLGDAIRNVFDLRLLWDMVCAWWHSLRESLRWPSPSPSPPDRGDAPTTPGHGTSSVALNFWFFLFVYYGFYNLVGLLWITKIFNMYSLNWWPPQLGFPVSSQSPEAAAVVADSDSQPSSSSTACRWPWAQCCTISCRAPSSPRT